MGVLFDYFTAVDDVLAATAIDRVGGPAGTAAAPEPRRRWSGRRPAAQAPLTAFDTVPDCGVDPVVQLGTLEELLTGRPYDDVADDPRNGAVIATRDGGEVTVLTVTDGLTRALAAVDDTRLAEVAVTWSRTEEFAGSAEPDELVAVLRDLAALAGRAAGRGERLYCWAGV